MPPDLERAVAALKAADASGDTEGAQKLAVYVKALAEHHEAARQQSLINAKEVYDPTSGMSTTDKVLAGVGSGMERFGVGLSNTMDKLLGFKPSGDTFSDEAIKERDKLDAPLAATGAGKTGQIVGQIAAGLPLSLAGGEIAGAGKLAQVARGAVEGAINSAATSDPTQEGKGAAKGAGLGATIAALTGVAGRVINGVVQKSQAAKDLEKLVSAGGEDIHIPITQAADTEGGDVLTKVLAGAADKGSIVPGVSSQLASQSSKAADAVAAAKAALPAGGRNAAGQFTSGAARKDLETAAEDVLGTPSSSRLSSRLSPYTLIGALLHPGVGIKGIVAGNVLATKTVQRAAMGDTAAQKMLQDLASSHPDMAELINTTVRTAAETQAGASNVNP